MCAGAQRSSVLVRLDTPPRLSFINLSQLYSPYAFNAAPLPPIFECCERRNDFESPVAAKLSDICLMVTSVTTSLRTPRRASVALYASRLPECYNT